MSLEVQNNLLELLSYVGLGNETANNISEFKKQQCLISEKGMLEFACRGDTPNQSRVGFIVDSQYLLSSIRSNQLANSN